MFHYCIVKAKGKVWRVYGSPDTPIRQLVDTALKMAESEK